MHRALRHNISELHDAVYSAMVNNNDTATLMILPCWGGWVSTTPYS